MKKISTVLLILVLVGSVAFAGFTGNATTGFGYNLDTGAAGFIKQSTGVSVDVNFLELLGEAKGEGDVYADIKATLNFGFSNANESGVVPDTLPILTIDPATGLTVSLDFDYAKIVGDNWYVNILEALDAPNFATSAIESKARTSAPNDLGFKFDEDKTDWADVKAAKYVTKFAGVEVGYSDYVASFGLEGNLKNDPVTYGVYGTLATPDYELADGLTVKVGAAGSISDTANAVSGSVKAVYKTDDYSASVAADVIYSGGLKADVALNAVIDPVTVDVYFATVESYNKVDTAIENLLSAKVAFKAMDALTLTVTGKDLINNQKLSASAKYQVNEELAVTGRGGYTINGGAWEGGADVAYVVADYTAKLGGTFYSTDKIKLNASIESSTLIPGATLKLAYAGDDLTAIDAATEDNGNLGQILASVKIAF